MKKVIYTAEQLAEWKKKYGDDNLRQVDFIDSNGEEYSTVICKPKRVDIAAFAAIAQKDSDKATTVLVKSCMMWTNIPNIFAEDKADCFFAVAKNIQELITVQAEEVKKL